MKKLRVERGRRRRFSCSQTWAGAEDRKLSPSFTPRRLKTENKQAVKNKGALEGGAWGKVTATAGVSWDGGQDVDSPFHFPSASISATTPRPHSLPVPAFPILYMYMSFQTNYDFFFDFFRSGRTSSCESAVSAVPQAGNRSSRQGRLCICDSVVNLHIQ